MAERKAVRGKERITVALFVTASGGKEKPIVIWKSENLKSFDKSALPVKFLVKKERMDDGGDHEICSFMI